MLAHAKITMREFILVAGFASYWPLARHSIYDPIIGNQHYYLVLVITSIILALLSVIFRQWTDLLLKEHPLLIMLIAFASFVSSIFCLTIPETTQAVYFIKGLAAACYGLSFTSLTIGWGYAVSGMTVSRICLVTIAAFFFGTVFLIVLEAIDPLGGLYPIVAPLISAICLAKSRLSPLDAGKVDEERSEQHLSSFGLIVIMTVFIFFGSLIRALYYSEVGSPSVESKLYMHVLTLVFCSFIFLMILNDRRRNSQERMFLRIGVALSLILLLGLLFILAHQQQSHWGSEITLIARVLLSLFLWILLINHTKSGRYPVIALMGVWAILESSSSYLVSNLIPSFVAVTGVSLGAYIVPITFAMIIMLVTSAYLFLQRTILAINQPVLVTSTETTRKRSQDDLARIYGLSPRELEIMEAYSRGKSSKAIAKELFISPETVRTHIKRLYEKLDIHKKQDLLDLIEYKEKEIIMLSSNAKPGIRDP